ncbi:MAG: GLPGLI family protein [Flavobacteriaceae bacterium]|nr:GLPGLI family protein [Flavobacteriaceae bacterium]
MKKLLFNTFLLLFVATINAQKSDKLSVQYKTFSENNPDELDDSYKSNPAKMKYYLMVKEWMESVAFLLEIDGNTSEFETIKKMNLWHEKPNPVQVAMDLTRYYVDSISFVEQRTSFEQLYLIEESSNQIKWELINETKIILGYTCYKATFTKIVIKPVTIEAWYAPELPYKFGPMGNHGLSGLILEIIQNGKLHFTATNIYWDDDVWVLKPTTGKKITREALGEMYEVAIEDMFLEKN